jgi:hypothetical protein
MTTVELPDESTIAQMVSNVSEVMFGVKFVRSDGMTRGESICGRMFRLHLQGVHDVTVIASSDRAGCQALASAFYSCPSHGLTDTMLDNAVSELLKMVALQIQSAMGIDKAPGSPRRATLADVALGGGDGWKDAVLLRSDGLGDLKLWVVDGRGLPTNGAVAQPPRNRLRSFLQRLLPH